MIFLGLGPDLGLRLSSIGVLACSNRCTVYYLAVGVLPLRPVRFVHDQQLDVLGGEEAAAREVRRKYVIRPSNKPGKAANRIVIKRY